MIIVITWQYTLIVCDLLLGPLPFVVNVRGNQAWTIQTLATLGRQERGRRQSTDTGNTGKTRKRTKTIHRHWQQWEDKKEDEDKQNTKTQHNNTNISNTDLTKKPALNEFEPLKCVYLYLDSYVIVDKIVFDICFTRFGTALTTILPILFQYCYKHFYSDSRNLWTVMRAGGLAL